MNSFLSPRLVPVCVALILAPVTTAADVASALHAAAKSGDVANVAAALSANPADLEREDAAGNTPLMLAAQEGHLEAVRRLLAGGANARHLSRGGGAPLLSAVIPPASLDRLTRGYSDASMQLLYESARPQSLAPQARPDEFQPGGRSLETLRAEVKGQFPSVPDEIIGRKVQILTLLLEAGASPKSPLPGAVNPLHFAAPYGGAALLEPLLRAGADPTTPTPGLRATPLHFAALAGNVAGIRVLLSHGADPEALTESALVAQPGRLPGLGGDSPLSYAIAVGPIDSVRALLEGGAKVESTNRTFDRPMHYAANLGNTAVIRLLLDRGARVTVRDRWQTTPLNYAASSGHLAVAALLIEHGADLESADEAGFTPLLDAIEKNCLEMVRFLAGKGASFNARTYSGTGPLAIAAGAKNFEMARALLTDFGQTANGEPGDRQRPLLTAVGSGSLKLTTLLLERGADANAVNALGNTPLHGAIIGRTSVAVAWRRDHGLPPVNDGATFGAMLSADDASFDNVMRILIAHGAKPDLADPRGDTPLHLAAQYGAPTAVALFLELGATRDLPNRRGRTALDVAVESGHLEIVKLLGGSEDLITRRDGPTTRERLTAKIKQQLAPQPAPSSPAVSALAANFLQHGIAKMFSDPKGAMTDFEHALEIDPQFADAYDHRGVLRLSTGDTAGSMADFDRAIALSPSTAIFFQHRGTTRGYLRDHQGALADFNRAVALDSTNAECFILRGKILVGLADRTAALTDFTRALELDPHSTRAREARALARAETGDQEGAVADYTRLIELRPGDAAPLVGRGDRYRAKRDHVSAIADYTAAIGIDPAYAPAVLGRALARELKNDYRNALTDYDRLIQLDPKSADAFNGRGWCRNALGQLDSALADYTRAIELNPRFPAPFHNRGITRRTQGDLSGSLADFDEALRLNPRYTNAYHQRAISRQMLGQYEAAVSDYDRYLAQTTGPNYAHLYRFHCLPSERRESARAALAVTVSRWNESWPKSLGRYLAGEVNAAALLALATESSGRANVTRPCEAHFAIGMTELAAGRIDEARRHLTEATIQIFPTLTSYVLSRAVLERLPAPPKP